MLLNPLARKVRTHHGLPVMSGTFPVFGHVLPMLHNPAAFLDKGAAMLGPLFWIELGFGRPKTLVYHSTESFRLFRESSVGSGHFYDDLALFFGRSLLVVDGSDHRHMRSPMNKVFSPRGLHRAAVGELARRVVERQVEGWARRSSLTILTETQQLTLAIIFGIIGIEAHEIEQWRRKFRLFMLSAINVPVELPGTPQWIARRARTWIDDNLRTMIDRCRREPESTGLLAELVRGRDEQGLSLTEQELLDNVRLLVLAGHETTASSLAWMMLLLADPANAHWWDRLCEEARGREVPTDYEQLADFPLARALFRESVRMHPPVYAESRRVEKPLTIDGHSIPLGTVVHIPLVHLSRDPAVYKDPERFDPTRWMDRDRKITPLETSQFGGGHHFCLGYHLAQLEGVQLAVAAANSLSRAGLRPALASGSLPDPVYVPLTHPPARTRVELRPA